MKQLGSFVGSEQGLVKQVRELVFVSLFLSPVSLPHLTATSPRVTVNMLIPLGADACG
jgi:hypothetical protein